MSYHEREVERTQREVDRLEHRLRTINLMLTVCYAGVGLFVGFVILLAVLDVLL